MAEVKTTKPNLSVEKPLFNWQSPEFVHYKKDKKWFVYLILITVALIGVLCVLRYWSGAALVLVAAVAFIILSETKPKILNCSIYHSGILVSKKVYDYSQFRSFWVTYGDLPKVSLQLIGRFAGVVVLPLGEEDPEQIKLYLAKHLPEEENRGEDLLDTINKYLHF